jgi:hypothetical protein
MWDHYWVNALFNKHTLRADSFLKVLNSGIVQPGIQQSHPSPDGFGAICKSCPVSVAVLTLGTSAHWPIACQKSSFSAPNCSNITSQFDVLPAIFLPSGKSVKRAKGPCKYFLRNYSPGLAGSVLPADRRFSFRVSFMLLKAASLCRTNASTLAFR